MFDSKSHWEQIYENKDTTKVSWYQESPKVSIDLIEKVSKSLNSKIIDVGGGDSRLVDYLLDNNYKNITVLDISSKALENSKQRLGEKAKSVKWVATNILDFVPPKQYDIWHDRAAFHFLTNEADRKLYIENVSKYLKPNGYLILGTFSDEGPLKCSGLEVQRYSEDELSGLLFNNFQKIECLKTNHTTPGNTVQNFLFCLFKNLSR